MATAGSSSAIVAASGDAVFQADPCSERNRNIANYVLIRDHTIEEASNKFNISRDRVRTAIHRYVHHCL
ncbi:helix-turn-helix domain-containing protein [Streptomyces sp. NPDC056462]|uniref:helix-turn-helix domain-containing protein n=1 Tax=Streptomyces sp. NPDC056462 TaxID=3345826 RepID=UPI0036896B3F